MAKLINAVMVMVLALFSWHANASYCNPSPSTTISISGNYTVQRDAPSGTLLSSWFTADWWPYTWCATDPGDGPWFHIAASKNPTAMTTSVDGLTLPVYATNVAGIGYVIKTKGGMSWDNYQWTTGWSDYAAIPTSTAYQDVPNSGYWNAGVVSQGYYSGLGIAIRLVKYDVTDSGVVTLGNIATSYASTNNNPSNPGTGTISVVGSANITTLACSLTNTTLAFDMGNVQASIFTAVGTVSEKSPEQHVGLNCDSNANINVTLTGTQNPDMANDPSILALSTSEKSSTGIGVQILYGETPLKLNQIIPVKTSPGGTESLSFTSRYYQTKSTVTAGVANAVAVLNISYQ